MPGAGAEPPGPRKCSAEIPARSVRRLLIAINAAVFNAQKNLRTPPTAIHPTVVEHICDDDLECGSIAKLGMRSGKVEIQDLSQTRARRF
jgi:hypothetical protein